MVGKLRLWLVALATSVGCCVGWATEITGTVLMPDGRPAVGAPVWLIGSVRVVAETKTDASGGFRFPEPHVAYSVAALPRGAAITWASVNAYEGGTFLLRASRPATLRGNVLGPGAKPLAGAVVSVGLLVGNFQSSPVFHAQIRCGGLPVCPA